ncbi:signal peptidase I [Kitasatospora sp. NPDC051853]|uniref:signal peptidase I n=1 Tax=Kitasatospora sp. NPDC051853 TaxID=3364058 RepID=UPI0037AEC1B3
MMSPVAPVPAGKKPGRRPAAFVQGLVIGLGFLLMVGCFAVIAVQYRPYRIPTQSMEPTLRAGDTVVARSVPADSIGRGDVVVFRDALWGNSTMVKRVVATGGDTVVCCDAQHRLTVNDHPVDEPYVADPKLDDQRFSTTVPEGRLFLLGDHRLGSLDSRTHLDLAGGTVAATEVLGRVDATVWPAGRAGVSERTAAFDGLPGRSAAEAGPIGPLALGTVLGAALILLASLVGGVASLVGRRKRAGRS